MTMPTCTKCKIANLSVTITATCAKCKASFPLCHTCKLSWNIKTCPSCNSTPVVAKWRFLDVSGSGHVTDDMLSYLDAPAGTSHVARWNTVKEARVAERERDGDAAHKGIPLPSGEVSFLRQMEDAMFEPIFTVADDRANYVVIEDGHVVKLRFFNADIRNNMPASISNLDHLREFRYEKNENKGSFESFPETFASCTTIETVVLRRAFAKIDVLTRLPNLKKLAVPGKNDIGPAFGLSTLEELSISGCSVEKESLDRQLSNLSRLKKLNLSFLTHPRGSFTDLPESMKQLTALEELDVRGTEIGRPNSPPWPAWIAELPALVLVHKNWDQQKGWDAIVPVLRQRLPEAYPDVTLSPAEARRMSSSEEQKWWAERTPDIMKIGWTGIQ